MKPPRIISLVPNGTEILFALGAGEQVVGVSHDCDYPAEARTRPILTGSALTPGMSAAEVDAAVSAQVGSGLSLYTLDEARIADLAPDVIVTQQLCPVCAVSTEQVDGAVRPLPRCPELVSLDPQTIGQVFADIRRVGEVTGKAAEAGALLADLEERLARVRAAVAGKPRPRVLALEWLDPPFAGGHWVPEMIEAAGGIDVIAQPGVTHAIVANGGGRDRVMFDSTGAADRPLEVRLARDAESVTVRVGADGGVKVGG